MSYTKTVLIIITLSVFGTNAQVIKDSTSTGMGYASQSFYKLSTGEVSNVNNKNWDIALSLSGKGAAGSSVHINELNAELYAVPQDTSFWPGFDTTGHKSWKRLMNSDTSWDNGGFNKHRGNGPNGTFDMGWGYLNPNNNFWVLGDSLYLCKLSNNSYKKIWIVSLKSGVWEFRYANLDGSGDTSVTIKKSDYASKNFIYYSLMNNKIEDREPNTDWDITFMGHKDEVAPGMVLPLVSVFTNRNVTSAKAHTTSYKEAILTNKPQTAYTNNISNIGREWKTFSRGKWSIYDSIAYFVYDNKAKDFYRIVFTNFGGSSTGKSHFAKQKMKTVDIQSISNKISLAIYPNPTNGDFTALINSRKKEAIHIYLKDISGKIVLQKNYSIHTGINTHQINIGAIPAGIYFVKIVGQSFNNTQKLIIK